MNNRLKNVWPWMLAATALTAGWAAGQTAARSSVYTDGLYGFSITAPRFGTVNKGEQVIPLMLLGPAENDFSPNVNVIVQERAFTRKQYRQMTDAEFEKVGATVHSVKELTVSGNEALLYDYENEIQGKPMHFLSEPVITPSRTYLITCTCTAADFQKRAPEFRACLASFKLTGK